MAQHSFKIGDKVRVKLPNAPIMSVKNFPNGTSVWVYATWFSAQGVHNEHLFHYQQLEYVQ